MKITKNLFIGSLIILLLTLAAALPIQTVAATNQPIYHFASSTVTPADRSGEIVKIIAGKNVSAVIEQYYFGVELTFDKINVSDEAFNGVTKFVIAGRNGLFNRTYWPHPLWPIPEGLYVGIEYRNIGADVATSRAQTVIAMVEAELGVSGFSLYTYEQIGSITRFVFYAPYGVLGTYSYHDFLANFWYPMTPTTGLGELINLNQLNASPLSIAMISFDKDAQGYHTLVADAYINPYAIEHFDNGTFYLSVNNVFGHEGRIIASEDVDFSELRIRIPYIGNVTAWSPETDNLFPDMTGFYKYTLKPDYVTPNNNVSDIWIKYSVAVNESAFPVLGARFEIIPSTPTIMFDVNNSLTFQMTVDNMGNTDAYNITAAIPIERALVEHPNLMPEPINITKVYYYFLYNSLVNNETVLNKFKTYVDTIFGIITNETLRTLYAKYLIYLYTLEVIDDFEEARNSTGVQQEIWLNITITSDTMVYHENYLGSEARNLASFVASLDHLAPGENATFNFTINFPGVNQILDPIQQINENLSFSITITINGTTYLISDPVIKEAASLGINASFAQIKNDIISNASKDIWHVPIGPLVTFRDAIGHNFFVFANGFATQINDPEPVLISRLTIDDWTLLIDQEVNATLTIENTGTATANGIRVTLYHAIADYNWSFRDIQIVDEKDLGDLAPGQKITVNFTETVRTRIGIHPVLVNITYTDDDGRTLTIFSNMVYVIVLPKLAARDKADYPYPTPELEISKTISSDNITVGDTVTVNITITNVGDEPTRIIIADVLNSTAFEPLTTGFKVYVDGEDITDTIKVDVLFNRNMGSYSVTGVIFRQKVDGRATGILLEPNQTLVVSYQVRVKAAGSLYMFPTLIKYTSLHPVYASEGPSGESGSSESFSTASVFDSIFSIAEGQTENQITTYSNAFPVVLQETTAVFPVGRYALLAGIALIVVAIVVVINQRRKKSVVAQFS